MVCFYFSSPGVIVTEVHKRAGMSEEQYNQVRTERTLQPLSVALKERLMLESSYIIVFTSNKAAL